MNNNAVELVQNQKSLKTEQPVETHLRPQQSEQISNKAEKFRMSMETPETIRTSIQAGEWVIDFKDIDFFPTIYAVVKVLYQDFFQTGR